MGTAELDETMVANNDFETQTEIDDALNALPADMREIVTLHVNGGFKFREIAAMTGVPLGTVLRKYYKAIERLRSHLSGGIL